MTAPNIKTDHEAVTETAAELRGVATGVGAAADAAAASVTAAAAKPVPAGARPSPAMGAVAEAVQALQASTAEISRSITTAASQLTGWEGGLGDIQADGAAAVEAQGTGGGGGAW